MNKPHHGNPPEQQLHAARGMIIDLQAICRELRQAGEQLGEACCGIEALDLGSPYMEEHLAAVMKLQEACDMIGPCMQKLQDCATKYGG